MHIFRFLIVLLLLVWSAGFVLPAVAAETTQKTVLYQSDFSEPPEWTTNSPTRYYWDPTLQMFHFKAEGGTNGYAFVPVNYDGQSFNLDYDLIILKSDKDSAFRFGLISSEMDFTRGTNVLSIFDNGKYGPLMAVRVIDQNNKLKEVTSYYTSYCGGSPGCESVEFAENVTYHVTLRYSRELQNADIKVTEKESGNLVWGFFVPVGKDLFFMDRLAITTRGDYAFGPFTEGYIDNVELAIFTPVEPTPTTVAPTPTTMPLTTVPTMVPSTPSPTPSPTASPLETPILAIALSVTGLIAIGRLQKRG